MSYYALAGFLDAARWLPLAFGNATADTLAHIRADAAARGWPWIGDRCAPSSEC